VALRYCNTAAINDMAADLFVLRNVHGGAVDGFGDALLECSGCRHGN